MDKTPSLSLLVAVYNTENLLSRCLDSLIHQTLTNIEIIVVNDGSTDKSKYIIESYTHTDDRIKSLTHSTNQGLGATRNSGLNAATGKYIAFIDSDDWIEDDYCEQLFNAAESNQADMVICGYIVDFLQNSEKNYTVNHIEYNNISKEACLQLLIKGDIRGFSWNKLYRRKLLMDHHLQFALRNELENVEDKLFNIRYVLKSNTINFIPPPLYHYTIHSNSIVGKYQNGLLNDILTLDKTYNQILSDTPENRIAVNEALIQGILSLLHNEQKNVIYDATEVLKNIRNISNNNRIQNALEQVDFSNKKIAAVLLLILVKYKANSIIFILLLIRSGIINQRIRTMIQNSKIALGTFYLLNIKYNYESFFSFFYKKRFSYYLNKKKALLTLLPTHNNMGDHAIAEASRHYIAKYFPEYTIIELQIKDTYKYAKAIKKYMIKNDLVFIIGGGNMGNLYLNEEYTRQYIINTFKGNHIIQLPQTSHFDNSNSGKRLLKRAKRTYNRHSSLILMARDKTSHTFMIEHFSKCSIIYCPDMVLLLAAKDLGQPRNGIGICLRSDKESTLTADQREKIHQALSSKFETTTVVSTLIDRNIQNTQRKEILENLWNNYKKVSVVITDRLHAMIFCAITQTPCIVMPSFNHKIREGFDSLKDLNFIRLLDNPSIQDLITETEELKSLTSKDWIDFDGLYFSKIRKQIELK